MAKRLSLRKREELAAKASRRRIDIFSLPAHPAANIVPRMSAAEFISLKEDIKKNGCKTPVEINWDCSMLIDGRHRVKACKELGMTVPFIILPDWPPDKLCSHVISNNIKRRSLNPSQVAACLLDCEELVEKLLAEATERKAAGQRAGGKVTSLSRDREAKKQKGREGEFSHKLAEMGNGATSPATVARTKKVKKENPKLYEKIKSGEITSKEAARKIADNKLSAIEIDEKRFDTIFNGLDGICKKIKNTTDDFVTFTMTRERANKMMLIASALRGLAKTIDDGMKDRLIKECDQ